MTPIRKFSADSSAFAACKVRFTNLSIKAIFLLCFSLLWIGASEMKAQYIYQYTNNTTGAYSTLAVNANCAATLTRVNGAAFVLPCSQGFSSIGFTGAGTYASTLPAIETFVAPNVGFQLNITQIRVDCSRAAANGPSTCMLAYSTDGVTWTAEGTAQTIVTNACTAGLTQNTWNVSISATSTLYIRAYLYAAGNATAINYLKNFWVTGTVVPVPNTGCTDVTACNYCAACTIDNGSCTYPGCTTAGACNYDATAGCDDGSCSWTFGCTNAAACNYNPAAGCDNGTCIVPGNICNDGNGSTLGDIIQFDCSCAGVTSPFNGISIEEIPIPPAVVATIDAQLTGPSLPRCWRASMCFNQPNWELQAIFGGDGNPEWWVNSTTNFYQSPFGSHLGTSINTSFYGPIPSLAYDSWFTINGEGTASGMNLIALSPSSCWPPWGAVSGPPLTSTCDPFGLSIVNATSYPTISGMPDADNDVLFAQLTTDGIFTGNFNFQIRRMNLNGTVYAPTTIIIIPSIYVDGTPGVLPDFCPIAFLPVELLSFQAFTQKDYITLNWVTATELNSAFFEIEKSKDMINWEYVLKQDAAGNSQNTIYYANLDMNPYEGVSYYRLKAVDTDGDFEYAPPIAVEFYRDEAFVVYPNPSRGDRFVIGGKLESLEMLNIRGVDGRIVHSMNLNDLSGFQTDVYGMNLSAGTYAVEFITKRGTATVEKLVVQK